MKGWKAAPNSCRNRRGTAIITVLFLLLLSGRFEVGRVVPLFAGVDLRWLGVAALVVVFIAWASSHGTAGGSTGFGGLGLFVIWCLWMIGSGLWADPNADIFGYTSSFIVLIMTTMIAVGIAMQTSVLLADWLFWLTVCVGYLYLAGALAGGLSTIGRLSAFGGGPNVFVRIMVLGAVASLALAVIARKPALVVASIPLMLGAVLSGSRGGVLSALVVFAMCVPVLAKQIGISRALLGTIGALTGGCAAWRLLPTGWTDYLYQRYILQTVVNRYTSGRDGLTEYAADLFTQHPYVGAGLGTFAATYRPGTEGFYAHNLLFSTGAEGGLVGTVLLLLAIAIPLRNIFRGGLKEPRLVFIGLSALFVFVAALFSGDYYDSRFMWFYLALGSAWSIQMSQAQVNAT